MVKESAKQPVKRRFATRLLVIVALAAMMPFAVIAWLAFERAADIVEHDRIAEVGKNAKLYSQAIAGRMQTVSALMTPMQSNIAAGRAPLAGIPGTAATAVQSVATVGPDGTVQWAHGTVRVIPGDAMFDTSALGNTLRDSLILELPDAAGRYHVAIAKSLGASRRGARASWLLAFPTPEYLWESNAASENVCVLGGEGRVLHCSEPPAEGLERAVAAQKENSGTFEFGPLRDRLIGGYFRTYMGAIYGSGEWTVVAYDRLFALVGSVASLRQMFGLVSLFAIAVGCLVASILVRRALHPLTRLCENAKRVATGDFSARVESTSEDEFGMVANHFNAMAGRLGKQWATLKAWSEVDRIILTSVEVEQVAALVLEQLPEIISCDVASITVFDPDGSFAGDIFTRDLISRSPIFKDRADAPDVEMRELISETGDFTTFCREGPGRCLVPHRRMGAHESRVFPIVSQSKLLGLLTLGLRDGQTFADEDLANVRTLCERLAVALDAASREEKLYRQANFDSVTGLANRVAFRMKLADALLRAERAKGRVGVLFVDLDGFKKVNDTHGHGAGDELLHTVGKRLGDCIRKTDTVARLGGDEFAVLLPDMRDAIAAEGVAQQILDTLQKPLSVGGHVVRVGCSIGIAIYPTDGADVESLLKQADMAMYRAKERGGNRFAFFEEEMDAQMQERASIEEQLGAAIEKRQIQVHYQPQVDTQTGDCVGVEALARWMRADGVSVPPDRFIAAAETSDLIQKLGDQVLNQALSDYAKWKHQGLAPKRIAVNVSVAQFRAGKLAPKVAEALTRHHVLPQALELEITESLSLAEEPAIRVAIRALTEMGVSLVIDDFGMKYSSLAYLKRLPARAIKIDRAFVKDVPEDPESVALVKTILAMAHTLKKDVVAEGIETPEQALFLRDIGCPAMQGYLIARPQPAEAITAFLAKPHPVGEGVVWFPFGRRGEEGGG